MARHVAVLIFRLKTNQLLHGFFKSEVYFLSYFHEEMST